MQITGSSAKYLKQRVASLGRKPSVNFYELAVSISKLHQKNIHHLADLPAKTGMSRRRVFYLLDVGNLIRARDIPKTAAEAIGWTKLQIVTRHFLNLGGISSDEHFEQCLAIARATKAHDLKQALNGQNVTPTFGVTFHLTAQEQGRLYGALTQFDAEAGKSGLVGKERALMQMVALALQSNG